MSIVNKAKMFKRKLIQKEKDRWRYGSKYSVEGDITNKKIMLFVLAGYKEYLWEDVFDRIKQNEIANMEVCIASSGRYCSKLSDICKKNDWVYVSTKLNNMCVLTNIVLKLFPEATYIFKLDEDIYIPQNYFENMISAYDYIERNEPKFSIGYICPFLPLGFFSMYDYLEKKGCLDEFQSKFGTLRLGGTTINPFFRENKGVDRYIWEKIGVFDDEANSIYSEGFSYTICPTRTGIAAILFKREFWNELGSLKRPKGVGWGDEGDESQISAFTAKNFHINFRIDNILVGHFAFGGAEPQVLKLKDEHPEYFASNR